MEQPQQTTKVECITTKDKRRLPISPTKKLSELRDHLELPVFYVFIDQEGFEVDINDERCFTISSLGEVVRYKNQISELLDKIQKDPKNKKEYLNKLVSLQAAYVLAKFQKGVQLSSEEEELIVCLKQSDIDVYDKENVKRIVAAHWKKYTKDKLVLALFGVMVSGITQHFTTMLYNATTGSGGVIEVFLQDCFVYLCQLSPKGFAKFSFKHGLRNLTPLNVALLLGPAFFQIGKSIYQFYKSEITGKECMKRLLTSVTSLGGTVAGGYLGAMVGGCIGTLIGGGAGLAVGVAVGSALFGALGHFSTSLLTEYVWSLFEKEQDTEARKQILQNARTVLNVTQDSSWDEVLAAWKMRILQVHPDKNPNATEEQKEKLKKEFMSIHQAFCLLRNEYEKKGVDKAKIVEDIVLKARIELQNDIDSEPKEEIYYM